MLFDKYKAELKALYKFYSGSSGMTFSVFSQMAKDFDVVPTFFTKRDIRQVFVDACAAHLSMSPQTPGKSSGSMDSDHIAMTETLSYAGFVEALGRIALIALDKPAFERLYPSAVDKVSVLLEMWGFGDPKKLEEIVAEKRGVH